ncbi:MAG: LapA family protein [Pseudomonadota bacterium]
MLRWALAVIVLLAAVAGLTLGVLNPDTATLDLGFLQLELSLGALIALAIAFGIVLGLLLAPLIRPRKKASVNTGSAVAAAEQNQHRALDG